MKIIQFKSNVRDYIWGGTKLKNKYHKKSKYSEIAESWELSAHLEHPSIIVNENISFNDLLKRKDIHKLLGYNYLKYSSFPLLVKLIDTKDKLSVQIHPTNYYAKKYENDKGKSEFWYILEAKKDAGIYIGLKSRYSKSEIKKLVEHNKLFGELNFIPVKAGDSFYIPAGTVHTIGSGVTLVEVQQNSNVTYRLYDYNRIDKNGKTRELNIDKALDVYDTKLNQLKYIKKNINTLSFDKTFKNHYFKIKLLKVKNEYNLKTSYKSFKFVICLSGSCSIKTAKKIIFLEKGDSCMILANSRYNLFVGECNLMVIYI